MFVPIYGESTDQEAVRVYTQAGFKVVPIRTNTLQQRGPRVSSLHHHDLSARPIFTAAEVARCC